MHWSVEMLNEIVAAEVYSLPGDMQAKFLRIVYLITNFGLEMLHEPQIKHLDGKLW